MATPATLCTSNGCENHYHAHDPIFREPGPQQQSQAQLLNVKKSSSEGILSDSTTDTDEAAIKAKGDPQALTTTNHDPNDRILPRIIRNFTPSWFIITMSTGVISLQLHQLPEPAYWLTIISYIFFVTNLVLFLLFTFISVLRYTIHPHVFPAVMRHPHQSLFVACFPVGLATLINMIVLVCAPAWGKGWATFAWVLWWIDCLLALATCFQLTYVMMSNSRGELSEMTALYLIPIVAVVLAAGSGGVVASALPNPEHKLYTLIISYILWGIGSPLSWIILALYFLRLMVHKPMKREVIVTLLLPIGPLGLEGFAIITLGKVAKVLFPATHALPHVMNAGDVFYTVGVMMGLILWGFAIVWFVVAVMMISLSGRFPFNMGWWGFIFPIGVFNLLTIALGEELASRFLRILSCVLLVVCIIMWLIVAAETVRGVISLKMFFAPCLGTDLFLKRRKEEKMAAKMVRKEGV